MEQGGNYTIRIVAGEGRHAAGLEGTPGSCDVNLTNPLV
jgi:hypothetical protein